LELAIMAARSVNNAVYRTLGDRWYEAQDDPLALLRAQGRLHAPWIAEHARARGLRRVLDVGCGAGFIANDLARRGLPVVGVDLAPEALEVAAHHDDTGLNRWECADARALPFEDASFDVACAMDFLEHVEVEPVVAEIARVLAPGGIFLFHTFNRNVLSWMLVIKGVELFVRNVPRDLHVLRAFVKPRELETICAAHGLALGELLGCAPTLSPAFFRMLATGVVPPNFAFHFTRNALTSYSGVAEKLRCRDERVSDLRHRPRAR
jgi:2-polyprenyl-6-hydroxyphenyl methylase/3-demethylubiquinone-9 3-methyltransferase